MVLKAKKNHDLLTLLGVDLCLVHKSNTNFSLKHSQRHTQKQSSNYSGCLLGQLHWHKNNHHKEGEKMKIQAEGQFSEP